MRSDLAAVPKESQCQLLRAKGYAPDWTIPAGDGRSITVASLPAILRILLVTDGTVTQCLEAYFWERIQVQQLYQHARMSEQDLPWLGVGPGESLLHRRVDLRGETTGRCYARCLSVVRLALLPVAARSSLCAGELGIGELIRERGLETYRELLEVGMTAQRSEMLPGTAMQGEEIYRTYRIGMNARPAILVTESFVLSELRSSAASVDCDV